MLDAMRHLSAEELLRPMLVQLVLILALARLFAWLFRRIGQPAVVGEIAAGLVLGPSVLGQLAPGVFQAVFRPAVGDLPPEAGDVVLSKVLTALAEIGLVLLLFLVGLEFDFDHLRWHGTTALGISLAGVLVPFGLGVALGLLTYPLVGERIPRLGFVLFMGTAMSITAIPVLGRMLLELGVMRTRLATITLSAAAIDDVCGWTLLAAVAAGVRTGFDPLDTLAMVGLTVAYAAGLYVVGRPLLTRFARTALERGGGDLSLTSLTAVLVLVFLGSIATSLIGIGAIFGAFAVGAVLSSEPGFREAVQRRLSALVTCFFLPIFFAYTGLRTNIGTLETWHLAALAVAVSAVAIAGKLGGCTAAAWLLGLRPREAACVGALMNTRGLMELVVINVGKDLGVIPDSVYCMLVLMALVTTVMTTPLLLRLMRGTELEGPILASGFVQGQRETPGGAER